MLPELLSSDLCSLRKGVDRLSFSVIWTMTSDADIIDIKFHKSLIRSSAALTYEEAQNKIDDPSLVSLLCISFPNVQCDKKAQCATTNISSEHM